MPPFVRTIAFTALLALTPAAAGATAPKPQPADDPGGSRWLDGVERRFSVFMDKGDPVGAMQFLNGVAHAPDFKARPEPERQRIGVLRAMAFMKVTGDIGEQRPQTRAAAACLTTADRPICLLKALAIRDGGAALRYDLAFLDHPEVLEAIGVTDQSLARWIASPESLSWRWTRGGSYKADQAVWNAVRADRAGAPPTQALAGVAAIGFDFAWSPDDDAASDVSANARMLAYSKLSRLSQPPAPAAPNVTVSPALGRAARDAWERELAGVSDRTVSAVGARDLAEAYAQIGDAAGVDRAMKLDPSMDDATRALMRPALQDPGTQPEPAPAHYDNPLADLDARIGHAVTEMEQWSLPAGCTETARAAGQIADARTCLLREQAAARGDFQRFNTASHALGLAADAARLGDAAMRREMTDLALRAWAELPDRGIDHPNWPGTSDFADLKTVAKAELKEQGRL